MRGRFLRPRQLRRRRPILGGDDQILRRPLASWVERCDAAANSSGVDTGHLSHRRMRRHRPPLHRQQLTDRRRTVT